jgi:hypothetical protein
MHKTLIDLWADIGSEDHWLDLIANSQGFVPFDERWPQPGFVGNQYLDSPRRVIVMGQNPRGSNTSRASTSDREVFRLIRQHAQIRTEQSLAELFRMTRDFMLGAGTYRPAWKPITAARNHLGLSLDSIAYLNLIPLATHGDLILPIFQAAYLRSTAKQLELLKPDKVVIYGKGAHKQFRELSDLTNVKYIEQRNYSLAPLVREWLGRD